MKFDKMDFTPFTNADAILEQLRRDTSFDLYPEVIEERTIHDQLQEEYDLYYSKGDSQREFQETYNLFLEEAKRELLEIGLYSAFVDPVLDNQAATTRERDIACESITNFIDDHDVNRLIEDFQYQNIHLANLAHVINKAYDHLVEHCDACIKEGLPEKEIFKIEDHDIHKFVLDCKDCCPKDITDKITKRVDNALSDFIEDKKKSQFEIQKIYQKAKQKVEDYNNSQAAMGIPSQSDVGTDGGMDPEVGIENNFNAKLDAQQSDELSQMNDPSMQPPPNAMKGSNVGLTPAQEAMAWAKSEESKILDQTYSVFDAMTRAILEATYKNDNLKQLYITETGQTDMETIINDVKSMYTVLETFNVLNIIDLNEEYLANMIKEMKNVEL